MKKLLIFAVILALMVPALIRADEPLFGDVQVNLDTEINENTDLIEFMLAKHGATRDDTHTTRETIDAIAKRSASGIIAPHFVQCWEDPYYFPRWTKRVTNDLKTNWKSPDGMYNIFVSSQVRTGYLAGGFKDYIPSMTVDAEKPLEKAIEELYKWFPRPDITIEGKKIQMTIGKKLMLINGIEQALDVPPLLIGGSTMVPLRAISQVLGAEINYDSATYTSTITKTKNGVTTIIEISVGSTTAYINDRPVTLSASPVLASGRVVVPFRFISEALGAEVSYDSATKTISMTETDILHVTKVAIDKTKELAKNIPLKVQKMVADYMLSMGFATKGVYRAFRKIPKDRWKDLFNIGRYFQLSTKDYSDQKLMDYLKTIMPEDQSALVFDMARELDYNELYNGALPLILSSTNLKNFLANPAEDGTKEAPGKPIDVTKIKFDLDTPFGKFIFDGMSAGNTYNCDEIWSVVDVGGNDTYLGPAAASTPERQVSAMIDMAGDDKYVSDKDDACSQGFGIVGIGILVDRAGNDTYESYDNSQGGSFGGVGLLWDEAGDDSFTGRDQTQGSGSFGVGNLVNVGGKDSYYCFMTGQGYGFSGGCGILIDSEGDDKYVGEPGTNNPEKNLTTPATGGHDNNRNYSFVQGAGWGARADMGDGHGLGGGTGILVDVTGDDWYECGVYGQATGYWFGTGVLADFKGNDHYEGSFFVQSGTAHMGMTELLDEEGNDEYHVWKAISQGGAHDFSVSWFIDKKGNDKYYMFEDTKNPDGTTTKTSGGVMLGSAITNSIGVHVDGEGDDYYECVQPSTQGYCLLRSGPVPDNYRYEEWCVGLFLDRGGNDTYLRTFTPTPQYPETWPAVKNNAMWKEVELPGNIKISIGFGLDCEKGKIPEIEW